MSTTLNTPAALPPSALSIPAGDHQPSITDGIEQDCIRPADGFGKRLKGAMREAGLTPAKLGKRVSLPTTEIKDILSDGGWCSLEQVRAFAAELGADMSWLWIGREPASTQADMGIPISVDPDADLPRLVDDYFAAMDAYERDDNDLDAEDDPLWLSAKAIERQIQEMPTSSPAGLAAIARIAEWWACGWPGGRNYNPDDFRASEANGWLKRLTRDTLSLAAGTVMAAPAPSPDAALLALHDRFIELEGQSRELGRTVEDDDEREKARAPLADEQDTILNRAWELTATTLEGHRARARMLLTWDAEMKNNGSGGGGINDEMAWLLVRDLLGEEHANALQSRDLDIYHAAIAAGRAAA